LVTRRTFLGGLIGTTIAPSLLKAADRDIEPEFLRPWLRAGSMPAMVDRLPTHPRIINMKDAGLEPGVYGGSVRTIIGSQKDIRYMTVYGYSRLIGYNKHLQFQPDILMGFTSEKDSVFTFHLREGHKWSDGSPFTADDFRYWWEDVILNKTLTPGGGALELRPHGNLPHFEMLDPLTVRYSWEKPNPNFMPALAGPIPLVIYGPGHYLKQFHKKYQDDFRLSALMQSNRVKKWADLHIKMSRASRPENPELPTLDPWRNTTPLPAEQFVFERNPFFHRIDENGVQLPYIDRFILNVSSSSIIAAKAGAGESDLQATGVDFTDYTFLKEAEKRFPVKVNLWKQARGSRVALLPNLNCADEVWRKIFRDVRFRRALSIAVDRHEINMVASARQAPIRSCPIARSSSRNMPTPISASIRPRRMRCSTRSALQTATKTVCACFQTGGVRKSPSRQQAKAISIPTYWNWCTITGAISVLPFISARRSATSSAAVP
jgi:peptide/nickel transport system substrate-binding protein